MYNPLYAPADAHCGLWHLRQSTPDYVWPRSLDVITKTGDLHWRVSLGFFVDIMYNAKSRTWHMQFVGHYHQDIPYPKIKHFCWKHQLRYPNGRLVVR